MVATMVVEIDDEETGDPVSRIVALALDWAEDGRLDRTVFEQIVEQVDLPARLFRELRSALEAVELVLVDSQVEVADPDDDDPEPGWNGSALDIFMRQSRHRILTGEEEVALAKRVEAGRLAAQALEDVGQRLPMEAQREFERRRRDGDRAAEVFVLHNIRLVINYAKKYRPRLTASIAYEDLIQEGYQGLATAVAKFDWTKGFKFSTYATWWIRQHMDRAIANQARTIRLPVHVHDKLRAVAAAERTVKDRDGRVTDEKVADELGVTLASLDLLRRSAAYTLSLDVPIGDGGVTTGDRYSYAGSPSVEDVVARANLGGALANILESELTSRERELLELRFGFDSGKGRTLEEVGELFGLTRERIRQIEKVALAKLASGDAADELRILNER